MIMIKIKIMNVCLDFGIFEVNQDALRQLRFQLPPVLGFGVERAVGDERLGKRRQHSFQFRRMRLRKIRLLERVVCQIE